MLRSNFNETFVLQYPNRKLAGYYPSAGVFFEAFNVKEIYFGSQESLQKLIDKQQNYNNFEVVPFDPKNNYYTQKEERDKAFQDEAYAHFKDEKEESINKQVFELSVVFKISANNFEEARRQFTTWQSKIDEPNDQSFPEGLVDVVEVIPEHKEYTLESTGKRVYDPFGWEE